MSSSSEVSESTVRELARIADLPLTEERIKILTPVLRQLFADLQRMDALELGDTPPETVFHA